MLARIWKSYYAREVLRPRLARSTSPGTPSTDLRRGHPYVTPPGRGIRVRGICPTHCFVYRRIKLDDDFIICPKFMGRTSNFENCALRRFATFNLDRSNELTALGEGLLTIHRIADLRAVFVGRRRTEPDHIPLEHRPPGAIAQRAIAPTRLSRNRNVHWTPGQGVCRSEEQVPGDSGYAFSRRHRMVRISCARTEAKKKCRALRADHRSRSGTESGTESIHFHVNRCKIWKLLARRSQLLHDAKSLGAHDFRRRTGAPPKLRAIAFGTRGCRFESCRARFVSTRFLRRAVLIGELSQRYGVTFRP